MSERVARAEVRLASRLQLIHELSTPLRVRVTDPDDVRWGVMRVRDHRVDPLALLSLPVSRLFAADRELARLALELAEAYRCGGPGSEDGDVMVGGGGCSVALMLRCAGPRRVRAQTTSPYPEGP